MKRISNADPHSLAACFGAAQNDADRFFGAGPVRPWRPRVDWRPWAAGAALVAVAAAVALVWPWATAPLPAGVPVAAAPEHVALAPASPREAAPDIAAPHVTPRCDDAACAAKEASAEAPLPLAAEVLPTTADPGVTVVLPENLEAWALDPQPIGAADPAPRLAQALVNTPVIPDELDATPADESAPDDEPVEPPAE